MITVTNRCVLLLKEICKNIGPTSACQLAQKLDVSERTVRYDLVLLTDWLKENDIKLEKIPSKGIFLDKINREKADRLLQELSNNNSVENRFLSSDERVCMIIIDILEKKSDYSFDEAPERFGVSRATFIRDLEKVSKWFESQGVQLMRKQRRGVRIDVDETVYRRLIINFVRENSSQSTFMKYIMKHSLNDDKPVTKPGAYAYINRILCMVNINKVFREIDRYLKKNDIVMNDDEYIWLIFYLTIMVVRIKDGYMIDGIPDEYRKLTEDCDRSEIKRGLKNCFPNMMTDEELEREAICLAAYIYSSVKNRKDPSLTDNGETARQISLFLQEEINRCFGVDLSKEKELFSALKIHLQAAIIRTRLGMPVHNEMLDEIRKKFLDIFSVCSEIAEEIDNRFGILFNEEEVGFITLYIALGLRCKEENTEEPEKVQAVLICGYGVGTVTFLTGSLKQQFPRITIADKLSVFDIYLYDFTNVSLVFTTIDIPIPLPKPVIKVSPILTKMDIRRIDSFLRTREPGADMLAQEFKISEIMSVISKYCDIHDSNELAGELRKHISSQIPGVTGLTELPALYDILPKKYMMAGIEADNWESAVRKAAEPMIADRCTTEEYVQEIIRLKERYNQYAVISNGLCMPHAEPNIQNKLACSLATLKKPVEIEQDGEMIKIYVVMVLSLSNTMSQAKALDEVFILLDEFPELPIKLQEATNTAEISRILKSYYNKLF